MKLKIILGLVLFGSLAYAAVGDQYLKGTLTAEQLTSTDDADIVDNLTCGDMVIDETDGVLNFSGGTSATISTGTADLTLAPATGITNLGTGDLAFTPASGAQCIFDEQGGTCGTRTDDANANNRTINSSDVWSFAATAKTPGNLVLRGGIDSKTFNVLDGLAGCSAADTAIVTRTINGTVTGPTTLTYGTDWGTGGGLTATIAATQLAAAIEALSGVGATASGATCPGGAAGDRCVGVTADRLTSSITISNNDNTCSVDTSGTDGTVVLEGSGSTLLANMVVKNVASGNDVCWTIPADGVLYLRQGDCSTNTAGVYSNSWLTGSIGARQNSYYATVLAMINSSTIDWYSAATIDGGSTDTRLSRSAAGEIAFGNGTITMGIIKEGRLGTVLVHLNSGTEQTIYTVPAGYYAIPTKVVLRNPSAATDAAVAVGIGDGTGAATCTDFIAAGIVGTQLDSTSAVIRMEPAASTKYVTYPSTTVICMKPTVTATDDDTVTATLFGYLQAN